MGTHATLVRAGLAIAGGLASTAAAQHGTTNVHVDTAPALGHGGLVAMQVAALNVAQAVDAAPELATTDGFASWLGSGWKRNVDVGINGAEGNTDNFSGRIGLGAERKALDMET
ncbi:MAG: hypothetical protein ACK5P8_04425, partial [Phycisphaerae bacterium]